MNNPNKQIVRGHINIIILKALLEGDKYGYEIGKYIESKSGGDYQIKQPTLYSSLKRLEAKKIIESYWEKNGITHGGRRKYFRLTEYGIAICSSNVENWQHSKNIIDKLIAEKNKEDRKTPSSPTKQTEYKTDEITKQKPSYSALPQNPRSKQLFFDDSEPQKDFEYKKILSKLLSNVKSDEQEQSSGKQSPKLQIIEDKHEYQTNTVKKNVSFNESSTDTSIRLNEEVKYEQIQPSENELKPSVKAEQRQIDISQINSIAETDKSSYSLLPSSCEQKYNGFDDIQYKLYKQGFSLTPFTNLKKHPKQYLLINKINLAAAFILYLLMAVETVLIYALYEPLINIGLNYYIYAVAIMFILPLFASFVYVIEPKKKTKKVFYAANSIISSFLLFMVLVLGIVSIALLFNIDTSSNFDITVKIIIPLIYAFNFVLYSIIWAVLYKKKKCFY